MDKRRTILVGGGAGTFSGTIAATQIAYGDGTDSIKGEAAFIYTEATDTMTVGSVETSGSTPYVEWPNYTSPAVSSASSGRIAYESATQQLRLSKNGAAYADMLSGTFTANTMAYSTGAGVLAPMAGLTWDNTNIDLTWAQGTITTSNPFVAHSATWNAAGVTFRGWQSNTTVTAAANGSSFWDVLIGGNRRWSIERADSSTSDALLKNYNAAGTGSIYRGEWTASGVIDKFVGNGTIIQWTIQADPGTTNASAYRIGLIQSGSTGTFGGDTSGTNISWVNDTTRRSCIGVMTGNSTCRTAGAGNVWMVNQQAAEPFRAVIEAGGTQGTTNLLEFYNTGRTVPYSFFSPVGRFHAGGGAVVAGDLALSAGWGTTATDAVTLATSRDQALVYTITSGGTGQAVNATITWTFGDGTWTSVPVCMIEQSGGTGLALGQPTRSSSSATAYVWIVPGLPVAGSTYEYTMICIGT